MAYKILQNIKSPADIKNLNKLELKRLAHEIRDYILTVCSENGGHLASNLGMVELTLALHRVFDSPQDKIVFDVSHQCYVHKLLTGRFEEFKSLRQFGGLSGFTKFCESEHDIFGAGHASTSLSAAYGLAKANEIKGTKEHIVAVIGDGALSGGMAFEALNNIGQDQTRIIIILNDNEMSIDKNVGSLTNYLTKLRTAPNYYRAKAEAHKYLDKIPAVGSSVSNAISKFKDSIKQFLVSGMLFEEMGITYIGVIDGHDTKLLEETLHAAKNYDAPILIHIKTVKGKGYLPAEKQPDKFHGVSPFDIVTLEAKKKKSAVTFSSVCGDTLCKLAAENDDVVAITAAMPTGTGLAEFRKLYPQRFFDVGIAEGHAATFAAGLARAGLKPFFVVYSTFMQRAYDQLIHDICIQNLPVTICLDRAGLVGNDGETHHGVFDLSYALAVPNLRVLAPKNAPELELMLEYALDYSAPLLIRYPRGSAKEDESEANLGLSQVIYGNDFSLIVVGELYYVALEVLEALHVKGINGGVYQVKNLKPLDNKISDIVKSSEHIITLENNAIIGGFGSYLQTIFSDISTHKFGIPDRFISHGDTALLLKDIGLDVESIANKIEGIVRD